MTVPRWSEAVQSLLTAKFGCCLVRCGIASSQNETTASTSSREVLIKHSTMSYSSTAAAFPVCTSCSSIIRQPLRSCHIGLWSNLLDQTRALSSSTSRDGVRPKQYGRGNGNVRQWVLTHFLAQTSASPVRGLWVVEHQHQHQCETEVDKPVGITASRREAFCS